MKGTARKPSQQKKHQKPKKSETKEERGSPEGLSIPTKPKFVPSLSFDSVRSLRKVTEPPLNTSRVETPSTKPPLVKTLSAPFHLSLREPREGKSSIPEVK